MPLTITRTAEVYRLWDDDDLRQLFASHAVLGWVSTLTCYVEDAAVVWSVQLQQTAARQIVTANLEDVIVSDGVTVVAQSVSDYNAANPDHVIEEPGS